AEKRWDTLSSFITDRFLTAVSKNPGDYSPLIKTLRPIHKLLLTPLESIARNTGRSESERNFAMTILADYASDDPALLAELLLAGDSKAFATLFSVLERQAERTLPVFQAEIARKPAPARDDRPDTAAVPQRPVVPEETKDRLAERQARAAAALIRLGH